MHRWFFANEREECVPKPEETAENADADKDTQEVKVERVYTDWPFCVRVKRALQGNECLAISGNCDELGNWDPKRVHLMDAAKCHCEFKCTCLKFAATVRIPRDKDIEYRYCIVGFDPLADDVIIRFWEVMLKPRLIRTCHNMLRKCERFGREEETGVESKVDRGWATTETYVHFKIFNAPFTWLQQCPRLLYVHLQPMYEKEPPECGVKHLEPLRLTTTMMPAPRDMSIPTQQNMSLAFTEVANLRYAKRLHYQSICGVRCGPEDLQLFHCSVGHFEQTLYRLDLYTFAHKAGADEPPYHFGYGFIKPEQLLNSEGHLRIKINCASTHRPLIEMSLRYLIIRPLATISCNLSHTFQRHWKESNLPFDIGHRGTGNTYRLNADVHRELTLFAFKRAYLYDADMVEMDVHLTKDAQVVIFHDYVLRFALTSAGSVEKLLANNDVFVFPYEQLNRLKLLAMGGVKQGDHIVVPLEAFNYEDLRQARPLRFTASSGCDANCERHLQDQMPFPLLSDLFNKKLVDLPDKLGMIVELKWPQQDTRRRWQLESFKPGYDRNFYVDTVLEVIFRLAGKRRVIFSSFDADICIMIRYKQNHYPVLLLLMDPELPFQFLDQRVNNTENAVYLAYVMELLGLNFHSNCLLKQPLILGLIRDLRMQTATWGTPNIDVNIRDKLKRYGIVGITYDRIDQMDQVGEELDGVVCCIDSMATRNYFRKLEMAERTLKCARP